MHALKNNFARDLLLSFNAVGKLARRIETSDAAKPVYRREDHWEPHQYEAVLESDRR